MFIRSQPGNDVMPLCVLPSHVGSNRLQGLTHRHRRGARLLVTEECLYLGGFWQGRGVEGRIISCIVFISFKCLGYYISLSLSIYLSTSIYLSISFSISLSISLILFLYLFLDLFFLSIYLSFSFFCSLYLCLSC